MSDSLKPHEQQHTKTSLSLTITWSLLKLMSIESLVPFNHLNFCCPFLLLSLSQHQGLFTMSQLFASGGQSTGASALASVLPKNIQCWFPLRLTGLTSLLSKGLSSIFKITSQFKTISSSVLSLLYGPALTSVHDYWKNHSFDYKALCWQSHVSRFVMSFLPRSKRLLISWLQWPSSVILEPQNIKSVTVSMVSHLFAICWTPWS